MSVENMIKTVLQEFKELAQTETVVGKPIVVEDTVIAVSYTHLTLPTNREV